MIVFVDYVTVLPAKGSCPERLPITAGELAQGRELVDRLDEVTIKVAADTGSKLLRASELTKEHDVCSSDPWVSGYQPPNASATSALPSYHPTSQAMRAIAAKLDQMLPSM